ncbi:SDR family NAD(P)-dependent oxidoreductase [Paenibacillus daejeonensis]|uniref:SDR family NAD(P)-dependent oxidoreductase n=1 Tax=Paenibacillus daejeonensis TaxID=135193 RepID=UPI000375DEF5|nr:SDR family NAD(P)-dependent oxidoreductase [Paenibacillus daejeonensis]
MKGTALVTGADRGLGLAFASQLASQGWRVLAGQYLLEWSELLDLARCHPKQIVLLPLDISSDASVREAARRASKEVKAIDLVIHNAAVSSPFKDQEIGSGLNYKEMIRLYNVNAIGLLRVTEAFRSLTDVGGLKRQCIISSEAGSIERSHRKAWFSYCMSKAALNMGVARLYEELRHEGYTYRLFHPGWMKTYMSGVRNDAAELEPHEVATMALHYFLTSGEADRRLMMSDWQGQVWPW